MRTLLLIITIGLLTTIVVGQTTIPGTRIILISNDTKEPLLHGRCQLDQPKVIDSCQLQLSFSVHKMDSTASTAQLEDRAILQIGTEYTLFYGLTTFRLDRNITLAASNKTPIRHTDLNDELIDYHILKNLKTQRIICTHHLPFTNDKVMQYEDSDCNFQWEQTADSSTIIGYKCFSAKTKYGGREWVVWYTPEIPINAGPWKFSGLPGLVLRAKDADNIFNFVCIGIEKVDSPMLVYKHSTQKLSKSQWLTYEKNIHLSPVNALGGNGDILFYTRDDISKKVTQMDASWSIPYNPIERE